MTSPAPRRRRCPSCATSFAPHPRKPSQIYCCQRCRHAGHRRRRRELLAAARASSLPKPTSSAARDEANGVSNEVGNEVPVAQARCAVSADLGRNEVTTNNGRHLVADQNDDGAGEVQRCPHCRQPIALVTLLLTPTAAHVTVPDPPRAHPTRPGR